MAVIFIVTIMTFTWEIVLLSKLNAYSVGLRTPSEQPLSLALLCPQL